jgi:hypothetical protein
MLFHRLGLSMQEAYPGEDVVIIPDQMAHGISLRGSLSELSPARGLSFWKVPRVSRSMSRIFFRNQRTR